MWERGVDISTQLKFHMLVKEEIEGSQDGKSAWKEFPFHRLKIKSSKDSSPGMEVGTLQRYARNFSKGSSVSNSDRGTVPRRETSKADWIKLTSDLKKLHFDEQREEKSGV